MDASDLEGEVEEDEEEDEMPVPMPPRKRKSVDSTSSHGGKGGSKGQKRHKADAAKKGQKTCRACQKVLPLSDFALNQCNCMSCKRDLDVISKKARTQGKLEWFQRVKSDPKQLKALLTNYRGAVQEAEKAGQKKATWNLVTYMEEVKASQELVGVGRGKMMWKDQAIEFWQSTDGGAMRKYEAENKWNHLSANYKDLNIPSDKKGPEKAPLRIRVHTEDLVDEVRRYSTEKSLGRFKI